MASENPILKAFLDRAQAFPANKSDYYLLSAFAALGVWSVAKVLISYFSLVGKFFLAPKANLRKYGPKGSWALVTGASDGIGKEYAYQLAQRGFNVVLVSRTESKLNALASEIEEKFSPQGIQTKTLAMDFAKNDDRDYERLKSLVGDLDIAILVNNVGVSHSIPVEFVDTEVQELESIINVNCHGTLKVTQIVVPGMISRKRGLILTMGSFAGFFPTPLLATYSGSKSFLQAWSLALGQELSRHNIDTELVLSHLVTSAMSKVRRSSALVPTPKLFVKTALASIGQRRGSDGRPYTNTPYPMHALMQWWIDNTVGAFHKITLIQNMKMHVDIRKRALRKREREAKQQ